MRTTSRRLSQSDESKFMAEFIQQSILKEELFRNQLRMLWTAYCLHQSAPVGSGTFECGLMYLWGVLQKDNSGAAGWGSYEGFEEFMSAYLC